jgi:hypothetical protein
MEAYAKKETVFGCWIGLLTGGLGALDFTAFLK